MIHCGRPLSSEETIPVMLLHRVCGEFVDDCRTTECTLADCQFVNKLAQVRSL